VHKVAIAVLALLVLTIPAAANIAETVDDMWNDGPGQYVPGPVYPGGRDVLYDNGEFETEPGLSVLQSVSLGMNTLGFGHQFLSDIHIADDFEALVDWEISGITFFAYQTNSPTQPSPITGVYFQIWNGPPDDPFSTIVWGDLTTNRLTSSMWSGVYRVSETTMTSTARPIMADVCSVAISLPAGYYWIEWMTDGSLASGPWVPPITTIGETTTGNAMQYYQAAWGPALDSGTSTQQGIPFIIEGTIPTAVERSSWSAIKSLYR
jgi:hypothetical protein